ncbi:MAG: DNA polymerase III subunit gamma/tau [Chloroflexota bacterium]|nr:DNA polymerase III subunit gamma/tau [Chloroflexota bacterium]
MTDHEPLIPEQPTVQASSSRLEQTRSLYRKYRPRNFEANELVGQEHIVRILRNAIRLDRIAHAYLFCGPRGTGKTTTARLLAKAVNCLHPDPDRRPCGECASCHAIAVGSATDVIEIDAASNRGIDDIRDLRERVKYAPVQLRTKFYIVDEAHQITGAAANAFLKTLEEPPAHTKFILATTDPEELLATIVSRCQRFDFRRIGFDASVDRLRTVAGAEGLAVDDEALAVIARHSTGSLRDGLSLLDQVSLYAEPEGNGQQTPPISADMVRVLLGVSRNDRVAGLVSALADDDPGAALAIVNSAMEAGEDPRQINRQLVAYLRVLLHQRAGGTIDADDQARALAARFELGRLADLARRFGEIDFAIKHSPVSQLPLEVTLVEATLTARPPAELPMPAMPAPRSASAASLSTRETPVQPSSLTTSLRDRVRGSDTPHPTARRVIQDSPSPPPPGPEPSSPYPVIDGSLTVDQLADLWPRIRMDVKALNRRIEALLASVDPVRVNGDMVTLGAAYPFHRDRMNTDEVRDVMESVIGRLAARPIKVECVLRSDVPTLPPSNGVDHGDNAPEPTPAAPVTAAAPSSASEVPAIPEADATKPTNGHHAPEDDEAHQQRLRAAKNLFGAEEIEPGDTIT